MRNEKMNTRFMTNNKIFWMFIAIIGLSLPQIGWGLEKELTNDCSIYEKFPQDKIGGIIAEVDFPYISNISKTFLNKDIEIEFEFNSAEPPNNFILLLTEDPNVNLDEAMCNSLVVNSPDGKKDINLHTSKGDVSSLVYVLKKKDLSSKKIKLSLRHSRKYFAWVMGYNYLPTHKKFRSPWQGLKIDGVEYLAEVKTKTFSTTHFNYLVARAYTSKLYGFTMGFNNEMDRNKTFSRIKISEHYLEPALNPPVVKYYFNYHDRNQTLKGGPNGPNSTDEPTYLINDLYPEGIGLEEWSNDLISDKDYWKDPIRKENGVWFNQLINYEGSNTNMISHFKKVPEDKPLAVVDIEVELFTLSDIGDLGYRYIVHEREIINIYDNNEFEKMVVSLNNLWRTSLDKENALDLKKGNLMQGTESDYLQYKDNFDLYVTTILNKKGYNVDMAPHYTHELNRMWSDDSYALNIGLSSMLRSSDGFSPLEQMFNIGKGLNSISHAIPHQYVDLSILTPVKGDTDDGKKIFRKSGYIPENGLGAIEVLAKEKIYKDVTNNKFKKDFLITKSELLGLTSQEKDGPDNDLETMTGKDLVEDNTNNLDEFILKGSTKEAKSIQDNALWAFSQGLEEGERAVVGFDYLGNYFPDPKTGVLPSYKKISSISMVPIDKFGFPKVLDLNNNKVYDSRHVMGANDRIRIFTTNATGNYFIEPLLGDPKTGQFYELQNGYINPTESGSNEYFTLTLSDKGYFDIAAKQSLTDGTFFVVMFYDTEPGTNKPVARYSYAFNIFTFGFHDVDKNHPHVSLIADGQVGRVKNEILNHFADGTEELLNGRMVLEWDKGVEVKSKLPKYVRKYTIRQDGIRSYEQLNNITQKLGKIEWDFPAGDFSWVGYKKSGDKEPMMRKVPKKVVWQDFQKFMASLIVMIQKSDNPDIYKMKLKYYEYTQKDPAKNYLDLDIVPYINFVHFKTKNQPSIIENVEIVAPILEIVNAVPNPDENLNDEIGKEYVLTNNFGLPTKLGAKVKISVPLHLLNPIEIETLELGIADWNFNIEEEWKSVDIGNGKDFITTVEIDNYFDQFWLTNTSVFSESKGVVLILNAKLKDSKNTSYDLASIFRANKTNSTLTTQVPNQRTHTTKWTYDQTNTSIRNWFSENSHCSQSERYVEFFRYDLQDAIKGSDDDPDSWGIFYDVTDAIGSKGKPNRAGIAEPNYFVVVPTNEEKTSGYIIKLRENKKLAETFIYRLKLVPGILEEFESNYSAGVTVELDLFKSVRNKSIAGFLGVFGIDVQYFTLGNSGRWEVFAYAGGGTGITLPSPGGSGKLDGNIAISTNISKFSDPGVSNYEDQFGAWEGGQFTSTVGAFGGGYVEFVGLGGVENGLSAMKSWISDDHEFEPIPYWEGFGFWGDPLSLKDWLLKNKIEPAPSIGATYTYAWRVNNCYEDSDIEDDPLAENQ